MFYFHAIKYCIVSIEAFVNNHGNTHSWYWDYTS